MQTLPYLIPYLISVAISTGIGFYAWQRRAVPGAAPFALVALAQASWTLGYVFELASPGLGAKLFWDDAQWLGVFMYPLAFWAFVLQYTSRKLTHPRRTWGLLAVIPTLFMVLVATDNLHGLVHPDARLIPGEPFSALTYDFTLPVWIAAGYSYGLVLVGIWGLATKFMHPQRFYRMQVTIVIVGVCVPLFGTVFTLMEISPASHRDLTPLTFAISNVIIAWGLFRYRLFDIVPLAREKIIERMNDAAIVLDAHRCVIDLNAAAQTITGLTTPAVIGQPAEQAFAHWPELVKQLQSDEGIATEIALDTTEGTHYFVFRLLPLDDPRINRTGWLVVLRDITARKQTEETLKTRLRYEEGLAACSRALLTHHDTGETLNEALRHLLTAVDASRVYLFENFEDPADGLCVRQTHEICAAGVESMFDHPMLQHISYAAGPPRWRERLSQGQSIGGVVATFPPEERDILLALDANVLALLLVPIQVAGQWHGFIGFDDTRQAREWTAHDQLLLQVAAEMISAHIERTQREDKLRKFSRAVEQSANTIVITGVNGTIEYVNPKFTQLTGYTVEETAGQNPRILQSGQVPPEVYQTMWTTLTSGGEWRGEFLNKKKNGELYWESASITPIKDAADNITHFLAVKEDITARKQAEQALHASEQHLRTLLEQLPVGVITIDMAGNLTEANPTALDLLGSPSLEASRALNVLTLPTLVKAGFSEVFRQVLETGEMRNAEAWYTSFWDKRTYLQTRLVPWYNAQGQQVGAIQILEDLTERKKTEETLRVSEVRNQALLAAIPDLMFRLSGEGVFLDYAQGEGVDLYQSPEAFLGKTIEDVLPPEFAQQARQQITTTLATGTIFHAEYQLAIDGALRDYESRTVLSGENEVLVLIRDITKRKQAEATLRANEEKFRRVIAQSHDGIVLTDEQGIFIEWNRGQEHIHGLTRAEAVGRYIWDVQFQGMPTEHQTPARYAELKATLLQFFTTGQAPWLDQPLEAQVQHADGTLRICQQVAFLIKTDTGFMLGAITRDITAQQRSEKKLQVAHDQLLMLRRVDIELTRRLDINYVLDIALDITMRMSGADAGMVGVIEDDRIYHMRRIGYPPQAFDDDRIQGQGIIQRVMRQQQAECVTDVTTDPDYVTLMPTTRAQIVIPLTLRAGMVGILSLETDTPAHFTADIFEFLKLLSIRVTIALQNAWLFQTTQQQHVWAEALIDSVAALNSTLHLDEVLERILENVGRVVPHDAANIMLVDDTGNMARVVGQRGYTGTRKLPKWMKKKGFSIVDVANLQEMARTQTPHIMAGAQTHPAWIQQTETAWIQSCAGVPIHFQDQLIGFLNLDSATLDFFTLEHAERLRAFADQASIAIQNAQRFTQAQELAALEERQRLAHDLHDAVSQTLFSANLIAEMLLRQLDRDPSKVRQSLEQLHLLTQGAQAEMRTVLLELRPTALQEASLTTLLKHLTTATSSRIGTPVSLATEGQCACAAGEKLTLYRIAQEALTNIVKHADATEVLVSLQSGPEEVKLCIRDNGRGFDPGSVPPDHMGLRIMGERAQAIGATLTVTSIPGEGTEVAVVRASKQD